MEPMKESNVITPFAGVDESTIRRPPTNVEAEQALLGAILINNNTYHRVAEFLRGEHFCDPLHAKLYDGISRLIEHGQVVSAITLKTYAEHIEGINEVGGSSYLAKLAAASVHVIDAVSFARQIQDLYLRRQLIDLGEDTVNGAYKPTLEESALEQIEIAELLVRRQRGMIGDIVSGADEIVEGEDQSPVTRMNDPRRDRKILVAVGLSGSQFARAGHQQRATFVSAWRTRRY